MSKNKSFFNSFRTTVILKSPQKASSGRISSSYNSKTKIQVSEGIEPFDRRRQQVCHDFNKKNKMALDDPLTRNACRVGAKRDAWRER